MTSSRVPDCTPSTSPAIAFLAWSARWSLESVEAWRRTNLHLTVAPRDQREQQRHEDCEDKQAARPARAGGCA